MRRAAGNSPAAPAAAAVACVAILAATTAQTAAATWARTQLDWKLPVDERSLRDRVLNGAKSRSISGREPEVIFLESKQRILPPQIVVAQVVEAPSAAAEDPDIVFLDAR